MNPKDMPIIDTRNYRQDLVLAENDKSLYSLLGYHCSINSMQNRKGAIEHVLTVRKEYNAAYKGE